MTEEQKYVVEKTFPNFEIRRYEACVLADVKVSTDFQSAGSIAFRSLIGYISGSNEPNTEIAMTSPMIQETNADAASTKIAMTSPVIQETSKDSQIVSFVMPAGMTMANMPLPTNSKVSLRQMPEQLVAVSKFTGRWTERAYDRQLAQLKQQLKVNGITEIGPPRFARFDPPWTPWFMRRNEIQIPIATPTQ
jgi:effector-binding domain-containing protein